VECERGVFKGKDPNKNESSLNLNKWSVKGECSRERIRTNKNPPLIEVFDLKQDGVGFA